MCVWETVQNDAYGQWEQLKQQIEIYDEAVQRKKHTAESEAARHKVYICVCMCMYTHTRPRLHYRLLTLCPGAYCVHTHTHVLSS